MTKRLAKSAVLGLATCLVSPCVLAYRCARLVLGAEKAFQGWSQALAVVPGLTGVYLRQAFYRQIFPRCGPDCWLGFGTIFSSPTAEVGRLVYVGAYCCLGDVSLEDDVLLGSHVSVINGGAQHGTDRLDIPIREQPRTSTRVVIGRDSWVGDRAVVLADVGAHCVIGAGAVVIKPIPDYAIAVGVPARVIRDRRQDKQSAAGGAAVTGALPGEPRGVQGGR